MEVVRGDAWCGTQVPWSAWDQVTRCLIESEDIRARDADKILEVLCLGPNPTQERGCLNCCLCLVRKGNSARYFEIGQKLGLGIEKAVVSHSLNHWDIFHSVRFAFAIPSELSCYHLSTSWFLNFSRSCLSSVLYYLTGLTGGTATSRRFQSPNQSTRSTGTHASLSKLQDFFETWSTQVPHMIRWLRGLESEVQWIRAARPADHMFRMEFLFCRNRGFDSQVVAWVCLAVVLFILPH
jgi:hypothetical protein